MKLTGLHLLLTYTCNLECDHCFVWGSPWQSGTLTIENVREILRQGKDLGTIEWIYFEGGEPFLYYAVLLTGAREAKEMGFKVGLVTNDYWANDVTDALAWLRPMAGLIDDFSISSDLFHWSDEHQRRADNAISAAKLLDIPIGVISVASPETADSATGQLPIGESGVMYRGRAAEKLSPQAPKHPWDQFTECPYENLRDPGRVHIDPLGYLHMCQGIAIGNLFETPLTEIWANYDPDSHPITGPLLNGGPVELVNRYDVPHQAEYADACHLCFETRRALRQRFSESLTPDQMYGVPGYG
jgi:MoaA/NifB/PqqE/SkfB family radical SAM enzyme